MKKTALILFALSLFVFTSVAPRASHAAEVVGKEWYDISWDRPGGVNEFQVYFGQANTGVKDSTIFGLREESKSVRLNMLKPCTSYRWNVKYLHEGVWNWVYNDDRSFTSSGACSATEAVGKVTTTAAGKKTEIVGVASGTATWNSVVSARKYNVYYREASSKTYNHALSVGANSTSVAINHLNPTTTYYYRVAGLVDNKEVWQDEKVLHAAVSANPVLGVYETNRPTSMRQPNREVYQSARQAIGGYNPTQERDY